MDALSPDQRVESLRRLEARSDQYLTALILRAIDTLLVFGENFSNTVLERIVDAGKHPAKIERALQLYAMMFRLMNVCEPKGKRIGPSCFLRLIEFETLTRKEALELKNGFGWRLIVGPAVSANDVTPFSALDLLSAEEKELYERVKPFFSGHQKPTLKALAARLLRTSEEKLYSERNILRYIEALRDYEFTDYEFTDRDYRREYLISSVNDFGTHNKSANESFRYAMARTAAQIVPVIREQMAQTAQLIAQALPRIPDLLPQIGQSLVLMRETHLRQTLPLIAQSLAQIPVVLPQLQLAIAEAYRSIPQTLFLLKKK